MSTCFFCMLPYLYNIELLPWYSAVYDMRYNYRKYVCFIGISDFYTRHMGHNDMHAPRGPLRRVLIKILNLVLFSIFSEIGKTLSLVSICS